MLEREIEKQLVTQTKKRSGLAWKFTSPGTLGVPDRIILLPEGRIGFVEVKQPGCVARPIQAQRIRQLERLGFTALVLDDPADIETVLDRIQDPEGPRGGVGR
ncbi:PDDEXK family nuclease [Actinotignum schaalii]|uniref:VRR-NUC domain-containing protein n=1 Tax=Actinotignum TaxID=1653174 RepID=UPI00237EAA7F|nr:VRR-NUC domain-containing protein [Actinotignum sanguinis]MDE1552235.1 VRR-NUC domain-containing protein [Actinotignum sanguinis]